MESEISLKQLPDSLKPIKPLDWKNACDWINARWGKTSWSDDTVLYEDARFWCQEELQGGLQYLLQKGGGFPPTFSELTKSVIEWRGTHLANRLAEFDKKLPAPRGSLRDYLNSIDIGYAFCKEYRGNGYAIEAAAFFKNIAFETLKVEKLYATVLMKNEKSVLLLKKIGFELLGRLKVNNIESQTTSLYVCTNTKT